MATAADARHMIGPHTVADWLALPAAVDGSTVELINGYLRLAYRIDSGPRSGELSSGGGEPLG